MTLDELRHIAEIFDGLDFEACNADGVFSYMKFFDLIGQRKALKIEEMAGKNNIVDFVNNLINDFYFELECIKSDKPSKSKRKGKGLYYNIMGQLRKINLF